jgi:hypothetical protein
MNQLGYYIYYIYIYIQKCPVKLLATQEAEIKRIVVKSQPRANSSRDPISKKPSQKRAGGV